MRMIKQSKLELSSFANLNYRALSDPLRLQQKGYAFKKVVRSTKVCIDFSLY